MATTQSDVEMADADRSAGAPSTQTVLNLLTTGRYDDLPSVLAASSSDSAVATGDGADLFAPFLPLFTRLDAVSARTRGASAVSSVVARYSQANDLRDYAVAISELTPRDLEQFALTIDTATPLYRQFEAASPRDRACIVLHLVRAHATGAVTKDALQENELVRNDIYKPHLVGVLVNVLAADSLQFPPVGEAVALESIVRFCLTVPVGAELIEAIVVNDPMSFDRVLDVVVGSIRQCNPLQATDASVNGPTVTPSSLSLLPFELRQAQATCSGLAVLSSLYATQIVTRLGEETKGTVAAAYIAFQLLVEVPSLRKDHFYALFVFQWLKNAGPKPSPSSPPLFTFLQQALTREEDVGVTGADQDKAVASSFQEEARYVMSQFRQILVEDMVQFRLNASPTDTTRPSRLSFTMMMQVLIGFLAVGHLHPEDHETTQLLRLFDKVSKEIPRMEQENGDSPAKFERLVSLMYLLMLFMCAPSAPAFAKMPSQREDSTKLVLQLAQQCIHSLFNTKAARPLFVLSSVLLYTKSPSLLPFLGSVIGDPVLMQQSTIRLEYLYSVGDVILKPVLTENLMAREVVTSFEQVKDLSSRNTDLMDEMTLRCLHGLLTEKSYLRHHHGHKLEEWITAQLEAVTTPVHPLGVNILSEWIENYIMAFEYPITQRPLLQLAVSPLSPAFVTRTLNHDALFAPFSRSCASLWAKAALVLTYALQFNQRIRQGSAIPGTKLYAFANQANGDGSEPVTQPPVRSSADIILAYELEGVPVRNILNEVSSRGGVGGAFEYVAPTLNRLVAEEFPQLIVVNPTVHSLKLHAPRRSVKHAVQLIDDAADPEDMPTVSWNDACIWVRDIMSASIVTVEKDIKTIVSCLLPVALLSKAEDVDDERVSTEAFFASVLELYTSRLHHECTDIMGLHTKIVEAMCMPQLVWRQHRRLLQSQSSEPVTAPKSTWIRPDQLIEQPFYILQNAYRGVLASPSLLKLVLSLVAQFRELSIFHLRRRDAIVALAKKAIQPNDGTGTTNGQGVSTTDPATQQFLVVQDCILIQTLLGLVRDARNEESCDKDIEVDERVHDMYQTIENLLADYAKPSAVASGSPSVALLIHTQGYDASLVIPFISSVPSLKQMWTYWTQPEQANASFKAAGDRRGASTSSASGGSNKAIVEFVSDSATEKDLIKWHFRVRVFFALCNQYFVAPTHTSAVVPTLKQILNRLRGIAVSSSGSSKGVLHAASIGDNTARVAFVEAVLKDAIDGCGRHGELRSEVTQFLLNLKKHVGSSSLSTVATALSPTGVDGDVSKTNNQAKPAKDRHHDLERVVCRAYQRILQFV